MIQEIEKIVIFGSTSNTELKNYYKLSKITKLLTVLTVSIHVYLNLAKNTDNLEIEKRYEPDSCFRLFNAPEPEDEFCEFV